MVRPPTTPSPGTTVVGRGHDSDAQRWGARKVCRPGGKILKVLFAHGDDRWPNEQRSCRRRRLRKAVRQRPTSDRCGVRMSGAWWSFLRRRRTVLRAGDRSKALSPSTLTTTFSDTAVALPQRASQALHLSFEPPLPLFISRCFSEMSTAASDHVVSCHGS